MVNFGGKADAQFSSHVGSEARQGTWWYRDDAGRLEGWKALLQVSLPTRARSEDPSSGRAAGIEAACSHRHRRSAQCRASAALVVVCLASPAPAAEVLPTAFYSGNDVHDWCRNDRRAAFSYVASPYDSVTHAAAVTDSGRHLARTCQTIPISILLESERNARREEEARYARTIESLQREIEIASRGGGYDRHAHWVRGFCGKEISR
jgi:hypothetical protein